MPQSNDPALGINSWLEDELYHQYQFDKTSVDQGWTEFFQQSGQNGGMQAGHQPESGTSTIAVAEEPPPVEPASPEPPAKVAPVEASQAVTAPSTAVTPATKAPAKQEPVTASPGDQLIPLRGAAARIAENMVASLAIPVATSQRQIPVRVIEENRNLINKQRSAQGREQIKLHALIAWAIVKAVKSNPSLNHAFDEKAASHSAWCAPTSTSVLAVDVRGQRRRAFAEGA